MKKLERKIRIPVRLEFMWSIQDKSKKDKIINVVLIPSVGDAFFYMYVKKDLLDDFNHCKEKWAFYTTDNGTATFQFQCLTFSSATNRYFASFRIVHNSFRDLARKS